MIQFKDCGLTMGGQKEILNFKPLINKDQYQQMANYAVKVDSKFTNGIYAISGKIVRQVLKIK